MVKIVTLRSSIKHVFQVQLIYDFMGLLSYTTRTMVTFGSPHQGVFGVPECSETTGSQELCELVRR